MTIRYYSRHFVLVALLTLVGCSSSLSPVPIPEISGNAAEAAIKACDSNGDQSLSDDELKQSPGLRSAIARLDVDKNKKITAEEINARIQAWRSARVGMTACTVVVRQNGQPVENAVVKFIPESFLGEEIKPAQGTTNRRGMAPMKMSEDLDVAGAHLGFYRVEISKIVDGKETIPARYNSESELGVELAADVFESRSPVFDLQIR
jgi:hypothetical protein